MQSFYYDAKITIILLKYDILQKNANIEYVILQVSASLEYDILQQSRHKFFLHPHYLKKNGASAIARTDAPLSLALENSQNLMKLNFTAKISNIYETVKHISTMEELKTYRLNDFMEFNP